MYTPLMARSKEHVNILTSVWLICMLSMYTHTQSTLIHIKIEKNQRTLLLGRTVQRVH